MWLIGLLISLESAKDYCKSHYAIYEKCYYRRCKTWNPQLKELIKGYIQKSKAKLKVTRGV